MAVVELAKFEQKTSAKFAVEGGSGIAMETVVPIFPEENNLIEEEGKKAFGPDFAGVCFVIHVEAAKVSVL